MIGIDIGLVGGVGKLRPGFNPADLGADLYDMWDAENAATLTLSGAEVSEWRSVKNGYAATQAVSAARPLYSATGSNGRPTLVFDGVDDELTYAGVGVFPTGSNPCEIWLLVDQTIAGADPTTRSAFCYGDASATATRDVRRGTSGGNNTLLGNVGTGASIPVPAPVGNFTGRHVVRMVFGAAASMAYLDGVAGASVAAVPTTGVTRTRIGARTPTTAVNFWQGGIPLIAVTDLLDAQQATDMLAYLKTRGGIA